MPFVPTMKITEIPRSSAYFKVEDTTPTYVPPSTNPTGYGVLGGPESVDEIGDFRCTVQFTGEDPVEVPTVLLDGNLTDGVQINYYLRDGVQRINGLYGMECIKSVEIYAPISYTWEVITDTDDKQLQCTITGTSLATFADALANVTHLGDRRVGSELLPLLKIRSIDTNTGIITLYESLYVPIIQDQELRFYKYYTAPLQLLLVNEGEGQIIKDISNMAITNCACDHTRSKEIIERILLKLAAQTAFACGNYVKAHNAAVLLSKTYSNIKPCETC